MTLSKTATKAARKIDKALDKYDLSNNEKAEILRIIGKSLEKTIAETTEQHQAATVACCGADADLAHKIAAEVELKNDALIANLMALR
jgi:predicted amino acid dehydrogenase